MKLFNKDFFEWFKFYFLLNFPVMCLLKLVHIYCEVFVYNHSNRNSKQCIQVALMNSKQLMKVLLDQVKPFSHSISWAIHLNLEHCYISFQWTVQMGKTFNINPLPRFLPVVLFKHKTISLIWSCILPSFVHFICSSSLL